MLDKQYDLKQLVSSKGIVESHLQGELIAQEELALDVMEYMLGCTIRVNGRDFILSSLELYYGGIGDMAHDWYRSSYSEMYSKKSRHSAKNTEAQVSKGPVFYFNQKGNGRFKRCDIVLGDEGVAASILIRNVLDESLKPIGNPNGQPNRVLKAMGLTDDHHLQLVDIIDTRHEVVKLGSNIRKRKRFSSGKFDGFDYDCPFSKKAWNYTLELSKYTDEEIEDLRLKFASPVF